MKDIFEAFLLQTDFAMDFHCLGQSEKLKSVFRFHYLPVFSLYFMKFVSLI